MVRLTRTRSIILMIFCFAFAAIPSWALDFNPGKYKITSKMAIPGMYGAIPPQTTTQCMTEQDPVPNSNPENQDCKITDLKQTRDSVSWKMECRQQGQTMTGSGKITYRGDSFEGTIIINMGPASGNMTTKTEISGQRISDCN